MASRPDTSPNKTSETWVTPAGRMIDGLPALIHLLRFGRPSQTRERGQLPEMPLDRLGRRTPKKNPRSAKLLVGKDSCLSAKDHSIADPGMVADAYLAAEDGIVANGARAGDAGLRGDDGIAPDLHVVANVHEVVDLGAASDTRLVERTAIDGRVGADLDVVFDDQCSLLRELDIFTGRLIAHIAKTIAAEHRARMHDDTVAKGCPG